MMTSESVMPFSAAIRRISAASIALTLTVKGIFLAVGPSG